MTSKNTYTTFTAMPCNRRLSTTRQLWSPKTVTASRTKSMDTSIKHTPLPWAHKRVPIYTPVPPEGEIPVFECSFGGNGGAEWQARAKANTAFIVQAVNSHYALVEALKGEIEALKVWTNGPVRKDILQGMVISLDKLQNALNLVTKGGQ